MAWTNTCFNGWFRDSMKWLRHIVWFCSSLLLFFSFSFLDGSNAEKVDFRSYAFTFRGFRGIPWCNYKMLQGLGFAATAMLGQFLFLQTRNIVTYDPNQYRLGGCKCIPLKLLCTARGVLACIPAVTKCFSCCRTLALTSSTSMAAIPEYTCVSICSWGWHSFNSDLLWFHMKGIRTWGIKRAPWKCRC